MSRIAATRPTLLIVDDDRPLCQMLAWTFEDLGYLVWTAENLRDAITSAAAIRFDCVLLDQHLPDGPGIALGSMLPLGASGLEAMLMSADPTVADLVEAGDDASGFSRLGFMTKPLRPLAVHRWFRGTGQPSARAC